MEKFLNDAVVGNQKLTASLSKKGELLRLFFPSVDFEQFIERMSMGVKVNDSRLIYLHDDINNTYVQNYIENTNILQTEVFNSYFNLRIFQTDYVPLKENILVRKYIFKNENNIDLNVDLLAYSKAFKDINNDTCGYFKNESLIQYNHDYSICMFSKEKAKSYQINNAESTFESGEIWGKDYVGLSCDSSISYEIGRLSPGEEKTFCLYIMVNDNREKSVVSKLDKEIERIRKIDEQDLFNDTEKYWKNFVKEHDKLNLEKSKIYDKIKNIYIRSILLLPLLQNPETGGISAGIEVDEYKQCCGRYSYCWPRDAVFITRALDIVGMEKETTKFYNTFCQMTQNENGMWEQRFYTDGSLAPTWGYQIDETASVIIGVYDHYQKTKNEEFLKINFKMCERAVKFLTKYMIDLLDNKNEMHPSYDLWEEYEGVSFYSISAVFSAMETMLKIDEIVKPLFEDDDKLKIDKIDKILEDLIVKTKDYALERFYDKERNSFVRNTNDRRMDISLLGAVVPFNMIKSNEKNMLNTIERINSTIRTYTGGYLRYEQDGYRGGCNPWPLANLWMALYCLENNDKEQALENFNFVVNSATNHGFLGEQVDNEKMEANWVIGLAWSHAMFLIVLEKLKGDLI